MKTHSTLLLTAFALALACDRPDPTPIKAEVALTAPATDNKKVAPNPETAWQKETIGSVRLGMTPDAVTGALGEPTSKSEPTMDEEGDELVSVWDYGGLKLDICAENESGPWTLRSLVLEGLEHKTERGIGIGSSVDALKKAYPEAQCLGAVCMIAADNGGMAFTTENEKVVLIWAAIE